ncbi:ABC transporter permease [Bdellovibrio sp. HCB337]|uniref:ABC transporter permease n=1 Tax=Bdellovibrio sp. HCB337 TaxID=3394358 RepID=UPI0039A64159
MKDLFWIAYRLLFSRRTLFGGSAVFSLVGLILGVGALVASMAVMSGFESTLRSAMADMTGHVQLVKRATFQEPWQELEARIRKIEPTLVSSVRYLRTEAVLAHQGVIQGVMIQGIDEEKAPDVLNFSSRLVEGKLDLKPAESGKTPALIGKRIAQKVGLKIGDTFRVVMPIPDALDPGRFQRRIVEFQVSGIVDMGKTDWNERMIISTLKAAQDLVQIGDRYSGLLMKFQDINYARTAAFNLSQSLGPNYWVSDWRDLNENLFEAVKIERVVIFFVVLIIIVVAAFNVSSTLFVNVVQRYADIAILKALGLPQKSILKMFSLQGLLMGALGLGLGTLFGLLLCLGFTVLDSALGILSGSVYRVDSIQVEVRFVDWIFIALATMLICFVATLAPALRGSKLNPVEGLKYG